MVISQERTTKFFQKAVATVLCISFSFLSVIPTPPLVYAEPLPGSTLPNHRIDQVDPAKVLESLTLPEELGRIEERFLPESEEADGRLILYLQTAHTNPDSEANSRKIIAHLQNEFGLPLVLLEGGEGKLDSLFFKSFPDENLKEKVLTDYLESGELSGGEIASILHEPYDTQYFGIESETLYNENKQAFLEAIKNEQSILKTLDQIASGLEESSKDAFSQASKEFYEASKAFRRDEIALLDYLKTLNALFEASVRASLSARVINGVEVGNGVMVDRGTFPTFEGSFPELAKILQAASREKHVNRSEIDIATNQMIEAFQKEVLPKLEKPRQMEMNQVIQMYRIGHLSSGLLTERIKSLAAEENFFFEVPRALQPAHEQARTISSIKGTKLFEELEVLEEKLRDLLPQLAEERELLRGFHELNILRDFARLELLPKRWSQIKDLRPSELLRTSMTKHTEPSLRGSNPKHGRSNPRPEIASASPGTLPRNDEAIDAAFSSHYRFYRLAIDRDDTLFQNALNIIKKENAKVALLSTGGFHREGITKRLKEANIPYLLISPKIEAVGDRQTYLDVMQGKRSFMKYFNGSLWDALAQDYAAKLAASLNERDLTPSLKRWRDRIIQNSIAEGRVTQATQYTKYVDALVQALRKEYEKDSPFAGRAGLNLPYDREKELRKQIETELNSFLSTYFERIESLITQKLDVFTSGLKEMWQSGDITPKSVGDLLDRVNLASKSNLAVQLALARGDGAGVGTVFKPLSEEERLDLLNFLKQYQPETLGQLQALLNAGVGAEPAELLVQIRKQFPAAQYPLPLLSDAIDKALTTTADEAAQVTPATKASYVTSDLAHEPAQTLPARAEARAQDIKGTVEEYLKNQPTETETQEVDYGQEFDNLMRDAIDRERKFFGTTSYNAKNVLENMEFEDVFIADEGPNGGKIYMVETKARDRYLALVDANGNLIQAAVDVRPGNSFGIVVMKPSNLGNKFSFLSYNLTPLFEAKLKPVLEAAKRGERTIDDRTLEYGSVRFTDKLKARIFLPLINPYYGIPQLRNDYKNNPIVRHFISRLGSKLVFAFDNSILLIFDKYFLKAGALSHGGHTSYDVHSHRVMDRFPLYHQREVAHEFVHELFGQMDDETHTALANYFAEERPELGPVVRKADAYAHLKEKGLANEAIAQMIGNITDGFVVLTFQDNIGNFHKTPIKVGDIDMLIKFGFLPENFNPSDAERARFSGKDGAIDLEYLARVYPPALPKLEFERKFESQGGATRAEAREAQGGLCVTGDTLLPIVKAGLDKSRKAEEKPIVNVKPGDHVLSLNEESEQIEARRIMALLDMGVKPVYRLTTASGRSIKTTANHPYLVKVNGRGWKDEGRKGKKEGKTAWVKVSELNMGDEIAVPDLGSLVGFVPAFNSFNEDNPALKVKQGAVVSDTEAVGARWEVDKGLGSFQGVRKRRVVLKFPENPFLYFFRKRFEIFFSAGCQLDRMHDNPYAASRSCLISSKGIQPFFLTSRRALWRDSIKAGFAGSFSSIASINQPAKFREGSWYSAEDKRSRKTLSISDKRSKRAKESKRKTWGTPWWSIISAALDPRPNLRTEGGTILRSGINLPAFLFAGTSFMAWNLGFLHPSLFGTSIPETRPDWRDSSREARNAGLEASSSSSISSIVSLSKTKPNVFPLRSTKRTMPFSIKPNFEISNGFKSTIFSSDKLFKSGTSMTLPPTEHKYTTRNLGLLDFFVLPEAHAAEVPQNLGRVSDILWDPIVSIEPLGLEHVYDIEVEGTHNFIGNGIFAHNTKLPTTPLPTDGYVLWQYPEIPVRAEARTGKESKGRDPQTARESIKVTDAMIQKARLEMESLLDQREQEVRDRHNVLEGIRGPEQQIQKWLAVNGNNREWGFYLVRNNQTEKLRVIFDLLGTGTGTGRGTGTYGLGEHVEHPYSRDMAHRLLQPSEEIVTEGHTHPCAEGGFMESDSDYRSAILSTSGLNSKLIYQEGVIPNPMIEIAAIPEGLVAEWVPRLLREGWQEDAHWYEPLPSGKKNPRGHPVDWGSGRMSYYRNFKRPFDARNFAQRAEARSMERDGITEFAAVPVEVVRRSGADGDGAVGSGQTVGALRPAEGILEKWRAMDIQLESSVPPLTNRPPNKAPSPVNAIKSLPRIDKKAKTLVPQFRAEGRMTPINPYASPAELPDKARLVIEGLLKGLVKPGRVRSVFRRLFGRGELDRIKQEFMEEVVNTIENGYKENMPVEAYVKLVNDALKSWAERRHGIRLPEIPLISPPGEAAGEEVIIPIDDLEIGEKTWLDSNLPQEEALTSPRDVVTGEPSSVDDEIEEFSTIWLMGGVLLLSTSGKQLGRSTYIPIGRVGSQEGSPLVVTNNLIRHYDPLINYFSYIVALLIEQALSRAEAREFFERDYKDADLEAFIGITYDLVEKIADSHFTTIGDLLSERREDLMSTYGPVLEELLYYIAVDKDSSVDESIFLRMITFSELDLEGYREQLIDLTSAESVPQIDEYYRIYDRIASRVLPRPEDMPRASRAEARMRGEEDTNELRRHLKIILKRRGTGINVDRLPDERIRQAAKTISEEFMQRLRIRLETDQDPTLILPLALVVAASAIPESDLLVDTGWNEMPPDWDISKNGEVLLPLRMIAEFLQRSPHERAFNFYIAYRPIDDFIRTSGHGELAGKPKRPKGAAQYREYRRVANSLVNAGLFADLKEAEGLSHHWEVYLYDRFGAAMPQTLRAFQRLLESADDQQAQQMADALLEGLRKKRGGIGDERAYLDERVTNIALAMLTLYLKTRREEASRNLPSLRQTIQQRVEHLVTWEDQQMHFQRFVKDPNTSLIGTTLFVPELTDQEGNKRLKLGVITNRTFHNNEVKLDVIWAYYSRTKGEVEFINKESLSERELGKVTRVRYLQDERALRAEVRSSSPRRSSAETETQAEQLTFPVETIEPGKPATRYRVSASREAFNVLRSLRLNEWELTRLRKETGIHARVVRGTVGMTASQGKRVLVAKDEIPALVRQVLEWRRDMIALFESQYGSYPWAVDIFQANSSGRLDQIFPPVGRSKIKRLIRQGILALRDGKLVLVGETAGEFRSRFPVRKPERRAEARAQDFKHRIHLKAVRLGENVVIVLGSHRFEFPASKLGPLIQGTHYSAIPLLERRGDDLDPIEDLHFKAIVLNLFGAVLAGGLLNRPKETTFVVHYTDRMAKLLPSSGSREIIFDYERGLIFPLPASLPIEANRVLSIPKNFIYAPVLLNPITQRRALEVIRRNRSETAIALFKQMAARDRYFSRVQADKKEQKKISNLARDMQRALLVALPNLTRRDFYRAISETNHPSSQRVYGVLKANGLPNSYDAILDNPRTILILEHIGSYLHDRAEARLSREAVGSLATELMGGNPNLQVVHGGLRNAFEENVPVTTLSDQVRAEIRDRLHDHRGKVVDKIGPINDWIVRFVETAAGHHVDPIALSEMFGGYAIPLTPYANYDSDVRDLARRVNALIWAMEQAETKSEFSEDVVKRAERLHQSLKTALEKGSVVGFPIPEWLLSLDGSARTQAFEALVEAVRDTVLTDSNLEHVLLGTPTDRAVHGELMRILGRAGKKDFSLSGRVLIGDMPHLSKLYPPDILGIGTDGASLMPSVIPFHLYRYGNGMEVRSRGDTKLGAEFFIAMLTALALREQVDDLIEFRNGVVYVKDQESLDVFGLALHMLAQDAQAEIARRRAA